MQPSRIYGHTDDLDMMLFITVGLWFGLRVVLLFVAFISRYRYHVLCVRVSGLGFLPSPGLPIRSFPLISAVTVGKFGCR